MACGVIETNGQGTHMSLRPARMAVVASSVSFRKDALTALSSSVVSFFGALLGSSSSNAPVAVCSDRPGHVELCLWLLGC